MINLDEIQPGDLVAIQDGARNIARGEVRRRDTTMWIQAFGVRIPFLRLTATYHWRPCPGLLVVEHTPALVGSESA